MYMKAIDHTISASIHACLIRLASRKEIARGVLAQENDKGKVWAALLHYIVFAGTIMFTLRHKGVDSLTKLPIVWHKLMYPHAFVTNRLLQLNLHLEVTSYLA